MKPERYGSYLIIDANTSSWPILVKSPQTLDDGLVHLIKKKVDMDSFRSGVLIASLASA